MSSGAPSPPKDSSHPNIYGIMEQVENTDHLVLSGGMCVCVCVCILVRLALIPITFNIISLSLTTIISGESIYDYN